MDGSLWRSIVDRVQPLLPSIDSNSSSSEDEGNIEIFQRPPGLSLKLPDDSDEDIFLTNTNLNIKKFSDAIKPVQTAVELNTSDTILKQNDKSTKYSHTSDIILSFAWLEQLNTDVFQNTKVDEVITHHLMAEARGMAYGDGDKDEYHKHIMKKIEAYCDRQSLKSLSSPDFVKKKGKSEEEMAAGLIIQEFPTVYIDLRCHDLTTKPTTMSQSLNKEASQTNKPSQVKVQTGTNTQTNGWDETGKSMLLRKIRDHNKINKCRNKKDSAIKREELYEEPIQLGMSTDSSDYLPEGRQHQCVKSDHTKTKMESGQNNQKITKRQRDHLQRQYQHIIKELEKCRPTKSVGQKQAAAEKTDLLYDIEASLLEPISTLPADIEKEGHLMLTVKLSSPGMVGGHGKRKTMLPALTKSHIYNTLVAWFLSLVNSPSNNEGNAKVPFLVAGLQQLWTENGLALHVLAVAKHAYTQKRKDYHTPFYNHICRFLSETSFLTVALWVPELNDIIVEDPYSPPICLRSFYLNSFITVTSNKKVISRIFSLSPRFYWQTLETPECVCKGRETTQEMRTEVSIALGCQNFFQHPLITHYTLQSILNSGLDLCGLRLIYPSPCLLGNSFGQGFFIQRSDKPQPVLAIAVRGPYAHSMLKGINISVGHRFRKKEAIAIEHDEDPLLHTPCQHHQVHKELCLWFSGRLEESGNDQKRCLKSEDHVSSEDASFLCATTKADILLVVSSLVPPCCYGQILATCECRGFILRGLKRLQLHSNEALLLGLTSQQAQIFCSPPSPTTTSHCLMLILKKENALKHSITLPAVLMREIKKENPQTYLQSMGDAFQTVEPSFCFHTVPYSNHLYNNFARSAWAVPDSFSVVLSNQKCPPDLETEQVVVLTLCGQDMSQGLGLLHRALTQQGFELLGLKWLPVLTQFQALEVSPYEVGEEFNHTDLVTLMSGPALVCALRRTDALALLRELLPNDSCNNILVSPTPQVASRQVSLFFFEHELIHYPPLTVCLFKPGVWNKQFCKILRTLQQTNLMLVGLHVLVLSKNNAATLLPASNDTEGHIEYLCSGSSLALCLHGEDAVKRSLHVLSTSDLFTSISSDHKSQTDNAIYASESYEKAVQDVKRLFPEGLCCTQTTTVTKEQIHCMHGDRKGLKGTLATVNKEHLSSFMALDSNEESLIPGAPWQTTCVLLPLHVPLLSQMPSQLDVLEEVLGRGCHLVSGKMTAVNEEQWQQISKILRFSSREYEKMALLEYFCPCLIVALKGESIVRNLNSVLESIYRDKPGLEKLGRAIIYPKSETEAKQLIYFLLQSLSFDGLKTIV